MDKNKGLLIAGAVGLGAFLLTRKKAKAAAPTVAPLPDVPVPPPAPPTKKRPGGHPPPYRSGCRNGQYDKDFWDSKQRILDAFSMLGYAVPPGRDTMNALGPDGKLGGGDDVPNPEVTRFQADYNAVSRKKALGVKMGGLDEDGLVGPCTLNALKYVLDRLDNQQDWPGIVSGAQ